MRSHTVRTGILFFGPSITAKGGIATVIQNYQKTTFWKAFHCKHLATMSDSDSLWRKTGYELFRFAAAINSLILRPRPCAVSVHTAQDGSFYRKLCYLLLSRLFGVPPVLHIHPTSFVDFYRTGPAYARLAVRLAAFLSDQIVLLSEDSREALADVFPLNKSCVLRNPVDLVEFADTPDHPHRSAARIVFLGWIIREKGVYDIVEAMPEILRHYPTATFVFAGNKEVQQLRTLIAARGLMDSAEIPGWVEGKRRLELLKTSSVLVLPSYTEGLPNVILEAMASRLPIVTTPVGAIPSVLRHRETAIFVEPRNVSAITEAILTLLNDESLRRQLAEAAFQHVRQNYSIEAVGEGLTRIYSRYCRPTADVPPHASGAP